MPHHHPWIFTALSVAVAVMGSWTALDLFERVRAQGRAVRATWTAVASIALGSSIWSMHFIAMLGFDPGSAVSYDPTLTAASLLLAIGGTAFAFFLAAGGSGGVPRLVSAGAAMGLAICAMHYVGMAAVRTAASLGYRPGLVALSLAVAVVAATAALWAARRERSAPWRAIAALVLGLAIVGMHYTAMAALVLTPAGDAVAASEGAPPVMLGVAVAAGTGFILFLALIASLYDQRHALLGVLDAGGIGYWEFDARSGALDASDRAKAIVGLAPSTPMSQAAWRSTLSPGSQAERDAMLATALRTGEDYKAEYQLRDGRWVSLRGGVAKDRSGRALKIAGVLLDVTDREAAFAAVADSERRQRVLINELNHRVKNTLATIQAIATLTARRAASVPEFVSAFEARLIALSKTHNLLTAQGWEGAELHRLLEAEIGPYGAERVALDGPTAWVPAEQALALGLVFHELATNAAKYGALAAPDGTVAVSWRVDAGELALRWREQGGPPVVPPTRSGFGSRLIASSVGGALQGRLETTYAPDGLVVEIAFRPERPAADFAGLAADPPAARPATRA